MRPVSKTLETIALVLCLNMKANNCLADQQQCLQGGRENGALNSRTLHTQPLCRMWRNPNHNEMLPILSTETSESWNCNVLKSWVLQCCSCTDTPCNTNGNQIFIITCLYVHYSDCWDWFCAFILKSQSQRWSLDRRSRSTDRHLTIPQTFWTNPR